MAQRRLCLITGGNTGIGYEVAKQLLRRGHDVIIACRDAGRAKAACEKLQQHISSSGISAVQCDLASLDSVRACAEAVIGKWPRLDVLVCNAATITQHPTLTPDGCDSMYQVNHLGHFLLTHLLLPQLGKSDAGRIVVVGSQLYTSVPSELTDPLFFHKIAAQQQQQQQDPTTQAAAAAAEAPTTATAMQRYALTKLYNLWFVKQLALKLSGGSSSTSSNNSSSSSKVVVNAVSPGFVPSTDLSRYAGSLARLGMKYVMAWMPFAVSTEEGGTRVAAVCDGEAEGLTSGVFYSRRVITEMTGPARDGELAAQLWQQSCKDAGIENLPE